MSKQVYIPSELSSMNKEQREEYKKRYHRITINELWTDYFNVVDRIANAQANASMRIDAHARNKKDAERIKNRAWSCVPDYIVQQKLMLEVLQERGEDIGDSLDDMTNI